MDVKSVLVLLVTLVLLADENREYDLLVGRAGRGVLCGITAPTLVAFSCCCVACDCDNS